MSERAATLAPGAAAEAAARPSGRPAVDQPALAPCLEAAGLALDGPDGGPLVRGLDLALRPGQALQLHGPTEAGAAVLRALLGLARPRAGTVRLLGQDPSALRRREAAGLLARVGWLPRDGALLANLTLRENLRLPLEFHLGHREGEEALAAREAAALARFGLADAPDVRPEHAPLPVRRRLALARAVVLDPALLLLDDPLDDLDEAASAALAADLAAWAGHPGHALLVTSPDPALAAALGARHLDLQVNPP
ncbi:MAG: ATP-binding cassette domain-containing protein [Anaeromyxobacter sp.]|nr:ATP-binding cassette domain-containing protein [Anaeromyxobacter sp.]MBL0276321.1 ATP-binding cassette domain-containing protein [Anaeromyxobacter sp.]